jgi:hypothetical protein
MEHAQALKLLGLDTGASTSAIEQAQQPQLEGCYSLKRVYFS